MPVSRSGISAARPPVGVYSWGVTSPNEGFDAPARRCSTGCRLSGHADRGLRPDCAAPARCLCPSWCRALFGPAIRKQPKTSVTGRQVDGPLDRSRSVAIVDDSIVSGMSLEASIRALENDGFEVEGVVALRQVPEQGRIPWAWSNGYRVETLFDIWADLGMAGPPFRPDEAVSAWHSRAGRVPDGLPLATAAR